MATIVSKTIPGENGEYGPYLYHVQWVDGSQEWTYLGRTDAIDDPQSAVEAHPELDFEDETDDAGGSSREQTNRLPTTDELHDIDTVELDDITKRWTTDESTAEHVDEAKHAPEGWNIANDDHARSQIVKKNGSDTDIWTEKPDEIRLYDGETDAYIDLTSGEFYDGAEDRFNVEDRGDEIAYKQDGEAVAKQTKWMYYLANTDPNVVDETVREMDYEPVTQDIETFQNYNEDI